MNDKPNMFYFSRQRRWVDLNQIVSIDYYNKDPNTLYITWGDCLNIELCRNHPDFQKFLSIYIPMVNLHNRESVDTEIKDAI